MVKNKPPRNPRSHNEEAYLLSEQVRVARKRRGRGLVHRVVLRGLYEHELEREDDGVDAEHRSPVLGEDRQRHESRVEVDVRVPRPAGAHHGRS